jgi:hypothetical protein
MPEAQGPHAMSMLGSAQRSRLARSASGQSSDYDLPLGSSEVLHGMIHFNCPKKTLLGTVMQSRARKNKGKRADGGRWG